MASKPTPKSFTLFLIFVSLIFLLRINTFDEPKTLKNGLQMQSDALESRSRLHLALEKPPWYSFISKEMKHKKLKIGLVNVDDDVGVGQNCLHGLAEDTVEVHFDRVSNDLQWKDMFPEWIDEDEKWGPPTCPNVPMPEFEDYQELDLVVARAPCGRKGVRDVFRLQVNLVVANLLVRSSAWKNNHEFDPMVYVVFIGSCEPMWEIFRCDDLLWQQGDYRVYKPDLRRLKQEILMPVGTCQLAPPLADPGKESGSHNFSIPRSSLQQPSREAYVTVLHSSEDYVCGAIALAQSIIQTNSTKDLVLLADDSNISEKSLKGLKQAGWKIKRIERIRSPYAKINAYNEWNYSKLRIWLLTEYEKIIFIDSDFIVLRNIDEFFHFPQLSAVGNDRFMFNSGIMLIEPSKCMFETLMEKRYEVASYNGGDQGFLNEVFAWWHRWPSRLNHLKIYGNVRNDGKRGIPENVYAMHYLGLKPWMCYKDYDCNWDMLDRQRFASDAAHWRWWQVYKAMPKKLRPYCALTKGMNARIRKWRGRAMDASFPDGHWKIKVKDPRRHVS